jgi:hypothetical protein
MTRIVRPIDAPVSGSPVIAGVFVMAGLDPAMSTTLREMAGSSLAMIKCPVVTEECIGHRPDRFVGETLWHRWPS